jgi:hypothetical protein
MKKIILTRLVTFIAVVLLFASCAKDYIVGGTKEDIYKYQNTTTYDLLKTNPLYDTLVMVIDTAGFKDKINEAGTTFFAPSDYAIYSYLSKRTQRAQITNQYAKWGLDSLFYYVKNNVKGTRDSLLLYLVKSPLPHSVLTDVGAKYPTQLPGDTAIVSYEYTKNTNLGYNPVVSGVPQVVYYTHLWKSYNLSPSNPAGQVPSSVGIHTLVITSGLITKNGIMNSLENSHTLFFYSTNK